MLHHRELAEPPLRALLSPRSVAVIGASRQPGTVGSEVLFNLHAANFVGAIFPVNPHAAVIQGYRTYPAVTDIPEDVDLAVVCLPVAQILSVVEQCAQKGVRAMVVTSAGFAELGADGAAKQEELLTLCRRHNIRLIGPNCMGIANTAPHIRLHATFGPHMPPHGRIGFLTQSGALGLAMIEHALLHGFGFSTYVSYGNKADVSVNDLLEYWEHDPDTAHIFLYLESFGNPRNFMRIAARVAQTKPVVVLKSARCGAGQRAATSHTAALLTNSDAVVDVALEQAGVLRVHTLEEFTDVAEFLCCQAPPQGNRVSIVTNAGGLGILCADACEEYGLSVPEHSPALQSKLRDILPPSASARNPVDLLATADVSTFSGSMDAIATAGECDAQIVLYVPPIAHRQEHTQDALQRLLEERTAVIPTVLTFLSCTRDHALSETPRQQTIPTVHFPETAARLLAHVARLPIYRPPTESDTALCGIDRVAAQRVLTEEHSLGTRWLKPTEVAKLCSAYRLPHLTTYTAGSAGEAQRLALRIGSPVALKAFGEKIIHKTELGAVRLRVAPLEVAATAHAMTTHLAAEGFAPDGFVVQPMAPEGIELFAGIACDPQFGPVLAFGAGGITVELFHDIKLCVLPVTRARVGMLVRTLKVAPLLSGYRGLPRCDIEQIVDLLMRLASLAQELAEISEIDCNPIIATPSGPVIVDARVRLFQKPTTIGTPLPAS